MAVDATASLAESFLLKLMRRDYVSDEERTIIDRMIGEPSLVASGEDIIREGDRPTSSTLLVEGFAGRYKVLADGGRQITALHGPGDFVDLHSFLLKKMDHGVVSLTPCRIAMARHSELQRISERHAHLSRLFSLMMLIDGAIHREWLVAMGRRTARGHAAHVLCEVYTQLELVGLAREFEFQFPITQSDLADILGLSVVHVNRVLQELRARQLISWHGPTVRILDWDRLVVEAEFDGTYLHLTREPR